MEKFKFLAKSRMAELPKTTGVYLLLQKNKTLYIGKAINIKSRVQNHFNQPSYRDNLFINRINKIGFLETGSEIEALILEANLIKKYQPKYNVMWRDDKNYFYVAMDYNKQKIPYVHITHQTKNFEFRISKFEIKHIGPFVDGTALKKTLRFLRRAFPYYTSARHPKNKCTWCHLDLCPGPEPDLKQYKKNIKKLTLVLRGKKSAVLSSLKKEMKQESKNQNFEKAGRIRDQIYALKQIMAHTHVINNIKPTFGNNDAYAHLLPKVLRLQYPVSRIECYDISNIQGKQATGSMVVFMDGKPDKNQYRKFKIRLFEKPNDIAMLKEVISRRLAHSEWDYPDIMLIDGGKAQLNAAIACKSQIQNYKFQINSKQQIPKIKIISIAKGKQELWIENRKNPMPLKSLPQEIHNLIKQLDEEAHRFAITYHKKLRSRKLLN